MNGKLYVVATPIGNLADFTFRAVETLKQVDLIACEDTRVTKKLLDHYQIQKPIVSYHQHSKIKKVELIINKLLQGVNIALVTDAGTPGISDPGGKLVAIAVKHNIKVLPIPGPSALTAALSVSGLPTDEFIFFGFLPNKKGRQTILQKVAESKKTVAFYESVHRIEKTLQQLDGVLDKKREIVVSREITKKFEHIYRGTTKEVINQLKDDKTKGEFVVLIEPYTKGH